MCETLGVHSLCFKYGRPRMTSISEHLTPPDLADIDALARRALESVPAALRGFAKDVVIRVEDFPADDVCAEMKLDTPFDILGLYDGVALDEKDIGASDSQPDMVFLYRRPILDYWAETGEDLNRIVRHVLIHEIGHHFGLSDADMETLEQDAEDAVEAPSHQHISQLVLLVRDYDEAIAYYIDRLGFDLVEDTKMSETKRWVRVRPRGGAGGTSISLLLAKATSPDQEARIGNQTGGRVLLFIDTTDFAADYKRLQAAGVDFIDEPRTEDYGTAIVFRDLYGNKWDLVERG